MFIPDSFEAGYTIKRDIFVKGFSLIGYKGLNGRIYRFRFYVKQQHKFFCILMFDSNAQRTSPIQVASVSKAIYAYVNQDDLKTPKYGTKENPIPIFNFKGVEEPIEITSSKPDGEKCLHKYYINR